jgi:hypothetical protein
VKQLPIEDDRYASLAEEVWRQRAELNAQRILMIWTWSALLEHEPEPVAWLDVMKSELGESYDSPEFLRMLGGSPGSNANMRDAMRACTDRFFADLRDTALMHEARRRAEEASSQADAAPAA